MRRLFLLLVACRSHGDAATGASTPEGAVRGALEAVNRGDDPSPFLLDGPRCRALYASKDAPPISERGRAADEASCAESAAVVRDELRRLPKGHITFSVGLATNNPSVGMSVPVTAHLDSDSFAPTTLWYAVRVNGRYYAAKKVEAPVAGHPSPGTVVPEPAEPLPRKTVSELRREITSSTTTKQEMIVIDGEYMGTDHDADGHERVGIVENAAAQNVEFTVSCVDPGLPPDVQPGKKLTVYGVVHRDLDSTTSVTLEPCFVK